jgi:hypothetical protein
VPGYKKLTIENWTESDPVNHNFARLSPLVGRIQMDQNDWAREFLSVGLDDHVPEEIRDLFEIARGAMLYGWFFYPLFRLGEEQLYRVLEAATQLRYRQQEGPKKSPRYEETITLLTKQGVIPLEEVERWTAARRLRNEASHPKQVSVMPPGAVLGMLKVSARDINDLFAEGK